MVDVGAKAVTARVAVAMSRVRLASEAYAAVLANTAAKGDVVAVAEIAGIQASKRTADLIPLCHSLALSSAHVRVTADPVEPDTLLVLACARTVGQTGVEMEALTAAAVAALTVYDMTKAMSKGSVIGDTQLLVKTGGRSGTYRAAVDPALLAAVPAEWDTGN